MGLANKKHTRMFSTEGSDADKIASEKLTKLETSFTSNEYLVSEGQMDILAPVLWQMQKMQEELDELRRYLTNDVGDGAKGDTGSQGPKGDTGAAGAAGAKGDKGDKGAAGADGTTPTMTSLSGSSLPTSSKGLSKGKLWSDKGIVKVA